MKHQLIIPALAALALLLGLSVLPAGPVIAQTSERCFAETGFCISGRIREFWEQNGGLTVFGYPITPQQEEFIEGRPLQVQWFQRNRLELHPQNARPYDVLLGRLGVDRLNQQGRNWFTFARDGAPKAGCQYFSETQQNVCPPILTLWRSNGLELDGRPGKTFDESLGLFGLPISQLQVETLSDGRQYQVQWFERARFELHPENAPPFDVLLGLLGSEVRAGGGVPGTIPPPPPPGPTQPPATTVPDTIDFNVPGRLECNELEIDEIFQPGQSGDSDIGDFDIPTEVPICMRAFTPNTVIDIEIRKPDGNRDTRSVTADSSGLAEWYYERKTGNVLGRYRVIVSQGSLRLEGQFDLERTPESEPKVLVLPREIEPGDDAEVHVGGLRPDSEVTLYFFRRCNRDQGCLVRTLGTLRANSDGQAQYNLRTRSDDPEDEYLVGYFRTPGNASSFLGNLLRLDD
jgi:hypothetical protein